MAITMTPEEAVNRFYSLLMEKISYPTDDMEYMSKPGRIYVWEIDQAHHKIEQQLKVDRERGS